MARNNKRLSWIDMARGFCMMAILLFHTEKYYAGEEIIPYVIYVGGAIIAFFFVSGYLFVNPDIAFSVRQKLRSMAKGIILPYFVFTTLIAVPKAYVHHDTTLSETLMSVVTGHASWFVAALIVTQLSFMLLLKVFHNRPTLLATACCLPFFFVAAVYSFVDNLQLSTLNPWCWQNACLMLFFFYLGYASRRFDRIFILLKKNNVFVSLAVIAIIMKGMECHYGILLTIEPIHVTSFTLLLIDGIICSMLVCAIAMRLPRVSMVEWTGKHSLYYYFICGGVPLLVTMTLTRCGLQYDGAYWPVLLAFVVVYVVATIIVWALTFYKDHH